MFLSNGVWETILSAEGFWAFVSLVTTTLLGFFWSFLRKKGLEDKAVDTLRDAVAIVHDEFVNEVKRASADGTLTKEEIDKAKDMAVAKALELATGPVRDLLLSWGVEKLKALVTRIVQGGKS